MPQNPGSGKGRFARAFFLSKRLERSVELRISGIVKERASEEARLIGRPCLEYNVLEPRILEQSAVAVDGGLVLHIDVKAEIHHAGSHQSELHLIDADRIGDAGGEQFNLHGGKVAHAEAADLSGAIERSERLVDLLGLHERVGAVEQQKVQIVGIQPAERAFDRLKDVFPGEIEHDARADSALGLKEEPLARNPGCSDSASKQSLALSLAVDIRMVEEIDSQLDSQREVGRRLRFGQTGDAHTAQGNPGGLFPADAQILHESTSNETYTIV